VLKLPERGVELALLDWGGEASLPLALFTHANGFCAGTFGLVAERLLTHYRVIGFDSRGHGDSSSPPPPEPYMWNEFALDVAAVARQLCDTLGFERVELVVGHSFGGSCAMTAAAREPELFGAVAAIDPVLASGPPPPGTVDGRTPVGTATFPPGSNPMAEIARRRRRVFESRDEVRARWQERGTFADWDPRALELYLEYGFRDRADGRVELKCSPEVEATVFEAGRSFDVFEEVRALTRPARAIRAADGNFPAPLFDRLAESSEAIEVVSVPGGHLLPMISPDLVADQLLSVRPA